MVKFSSFALLATSVAAADPMPTQWNYNQLGADWPNLTFSAFGTPIENKCGGGPNAPNQSPIDFKSKKNNYRTFDVALDHPFLKYSS